MTQETEPEAVSATPARLRIVDVTEAEWGEPMFGGAAKRLFDGPDGSHLDYVLFHANSAPDRSNPGKGPHYHTYHEWGFVLSGHFIIYDFVHPKQVQGELVHFREGTLMSRPAFSLHSGEGYPRRAFRQNSCVLLNYEEGPSHVLLASPDNIPPDVVDWPHDFIKQSATSMEWEPDPELEGASMKWLREDPIGGFRVKLRFVGPGWQAPDGKRSTSFKTAHRFSYVTQGDMALIDGPDTVTLRDDSLVDQAPGSIWAWPEGSVSEAGCTWLEVTYASGTALSAGPIEEPTIA